MSALSYDAVLVLADLLQNPGFQVSPHRLPQGFCWPGVTGNVSFDSEGNRNGQLEMLKVTGGTLRTGQELSVTRWRSLEARCPHRAAVVHCDGSLRTPFGV